MSGQELNRKEREKGKCPWPKYIQKIRWDEGEGDGQIGERNNEHG